MYVNELRQARAMSEENARLKRIVADLTLQIDVLKAVNATKCGAGTSWWIRLNRVVCSVS